MMRYACLAAVCAVTGFGQLALPVVKAPVPKRDVQLNAAAQEAVDLSGQWTSGDNHPTVGPDGRVLYSFGSGLPVVVCAPLHICVIELQAGEKVAGEPHLGDTVRWRITPASYGTGAGETNAIVLKPLESGLDTDLVIPTDRRAYYIRLVSKPTEYVARTAFKYPEEENAAVWRKKAEEQRESDRKVEQLQTRPVLLPSMEAAERLDFNYTVTVHSKSSHIRPTKVYSDTTDGKTFIRMPADMKSREAPVLLIVGTDGKSEVTNYRVDVNTYIVDRLADHFQLKLGVGKKADTVDIQHDKRERT